MSDNILLVIVVGLVATAVGAAVGYFVRQQVARSEEKEHRAEIERIKATTEAHERELELKGRDELIKRRDELEAEIARKRNEVTDLGKLLDPMADTLLHLPLFLGFTHGIVQLPLWLVLIFVYREFLISVLRSFCALRGVALAARPFGKKKTIIQACAAIAIVVLLLGVDQGLISEGFLQQMSVWLTLLAVFYSVGSAVEYLLVARRQV